MKNLFSRLLPLEKVIALAARFGFLAKPIGVLAEGWAKAQGYRSQLCILAAASLAAAAALGFVKWELVDPVIQALLGLASAALLDKWNRIAPTVKKVSADVAEKAKENEGPRA